MSALLIEISMFFMRVTAVVMVGVSLSAWALYAFWCYDLWLEVFRRGEPVVGGAIVYVYYVVAGFLCAAFCTAATAGIWWNAWY